MPLKRELIFIDGVNKTDEIHFFSYHDDKCIITYKNNNKEYAYSRNRVAIVKSAISDNKPNSVFTYLTKIAETIGLKTEQGNNILQNSYERISFIPNDCILACYLKGVMPLPGDNHQQVQIFPFGFNISQKEAVNNAFSHPLSIIEGPPGTGKTQTILNIIANAVINGQRVAIVSNNNSATKNVYEKLEKSGINFIAALLGNSENKKEFIGSQISIPDLSKYRLSDSEKKKAEESLQSLFTRLTENLYKKNELALLKQELDHIETEYQHYQHAHSENAGNSSAFKKKITTDDLLSLWASIESQALKFKGFNFLKKLVFRIKYGIKDKLFYTYSFDKMICLCQSKYYLTKIHQLRKRIKDIETLLTDFSFDTKMKDYTALSMLLLKGELYKKYITGTRKQYEIKDLHNNSADFLTDYPVIMSTTYSLKRSLSDAISYDYIIIDESSQVDIATGALALSCAKKTVIVGDLKQLPNVVDFELQNKTNFVFESFDLPASYRYSNHSLLSSVTELFPNVAKTLLREHYRCHPKIIEFCNKKFYSNQLIILTESSNKRRSPLVLYKTTPGNHERGRMNQRQIDVIKQEIIPREQLETVDLGIVTPYRNQTNALQEAFNNTAIKADTVDKFQGRENEVIILSTVDDKISEFTDNLNRLNVAVSRAIDQLILVVNGNKLESDSNISDLIRYIEYNNFSVVHSDLYSIFDYLYKGFEEKRAKIISKTGKVSEFDSENLMHVLIKEVLGDDKFSKYDVLLHFPLRSLIKDFSKLSEREKTYANHPFTHLDFLVYNKLGKSAVLAIEVDGFAFHEKGTIQSVRDLMKDKVLEKYGIPLIRFATNGSGEKGKLIEKLNELQKTP
jgi:superfamily I DNA and/or RNA helicase